MMPSLMRLDKLVGSVEVADSDLNLDYSLFVSWSDGKYRTLT
jgi:hypothetical protein